MEGLGLYNEVVAITDLLLNLLDLVAGEAWHDTVYECSIDATSLLEPLLEVGTQVPQVDILIDAILQHMAIEEDQLTREDDQALGRITVERLETTIEQLNQFARIRAGGRIFELTAWIEGDTSLSGVRDDETDLWLIGECHEGSVLCVGVECTADHIDTL